MPVAPTYPGVYVEELPSTNHSVTPAPTSVTAFVGYTHPYKTVSPGIAVELHNFADYVAAFGGFFSHPLLPDYVGQAVFQFFANGGSTAYVVGLAASYTYTPAGAPGAVSVAVSTLAPTVSCPATGGNLVFTAKEPVPLASGSDGVAMKLTVNNLRKTNTANDTADIVITYGHAVETYRRVVITDVGNRLAQSALVSSVVWDQPGSPTTYDKPHDLPFVYPPHNSAVPDATWTVFNLADFTATPAGTPGVFDSNSSLDKTDAVNLVAVPGISGTLPGMPAAQTFAVLSDALVFCERKLAVLIVDPPAYAVADSAETGDADATKIAKADGATVAPIDTLVTAFPSATNAALYFPWVQTVDPVTGSTDAQSPPSGFVAGILAKNDSTRGVWKSPAGLETVLTGTTGVVPWGRMTDLRQGDLNPLGINCLRLFPGIGTVVFGARTLAAANPAFEQYKYVSVRRTALFIEQSLKASLTWAVFEPNDEQLWTALRLEVQAFMLSLFRQGAFPGTTPEASFQVQCDATTTTPNDVSQGTVNLVVSFAPLKPAEFVVIKIAQLAGQV